MICNSILMKLKNKKCINLNNNKIFELIKLSKGNSDNYFSNKKKGFSNAHLEIIAYCFLYLSSLEI